MATALENALLPRGPSVGDAFGECFFSALCEFLAKQDFPSSPWEWSDDTHMAVSLVETLRDHGEIRSSRNSSVIRATSAGRDVRHRCDARFQDVSDPVARGERPGATTRATATIAPSFLNSIRRDWRASSATRSSVTTAVARLSRELRASRTRDTGSLRGGARRQISPRRAVAIYCFDEAASARGSTRCLYQRGKAGARLLRSGGSEAPSQSHQRAAARGRIPGPSKARRLVPEDVTARLAEWLSALGQR